MYFAAKENKRTHHFLDRNIRDIPYASLRTQQQRENHRRTGHEGGQPHRRGRVGAGRARAR